MATGLGRELAESQDRIDTSLKHLIEQWEGKTMRLLWEVYEHSAHQQSVVQQLIALGRTDAGQPVSLDVNEVLTGLEPILKKGLGTRRFLTLKLQPGIPPILTYPGHLRESLLRLVADARHATRDGGVVEISTAAIISADGKHSVQIAVRDNRKGLRDNVRERVFDPYYQSHRGKRNPGLSLALVYHFVALSGGSIDVESMPGEGSAYLLNFPLTDDLPMPSESDGPKAGDEMVENAHATVAA